MYLNWCNPILQGLSRIDCCTYWSDNKLASNSQLHRCYEIYVTDEHEGRNTSCLRGKWDRGKIKREREKKGEQDTRRESQATNPVPSPFQTQNNHFIMYLWPAKRAHPTWQRSVTYNSLFLSHSIFSFLTYMYVPSFPQNRQHTHIKLHHDISI